MCNRKESWERQLLFSFFLSLHLFFKVYPSLSHIKKKRESRERMEVKKQLIQVKNGDCAILDNKKPYSPRGVELSIVMDTSDHFDIIHTACGKRMELSIKETECPKVMYLHYEVRCVHCNTQWMRWRKTNLNEEEGEYRPRMRTTARRGEASIQRAPRRRDCVVKNPLKQGHPLHLSDYFFIHANETENIVDCCDKHSEYGKFSGNQHVDYFLDLMKRLEAHYEENGKRGFWVNRSTIFRDAERVTFVVEKNSMQMVGFYMLQVFGKAVIIEMLQTFPPLHGYGRMIVKKLQNEYDEVSCLDSVNDSIGFWNKVNVLQSESRGTKRKREKKDC